MVLWPDLIEGVTSRARLHLLAENKQGKGKHPENNLPLFTMLTLLVFLEGLACCTFYVRFSGILKSWAGWGHWMPATGMALTPNVPSYSYSKKTNNISNISKRRKMRASLCALIFEVRSYAPRWWSGVAQVPESAPKRPPKGPNPPNLTQGCAVPFFSPCRPAFANGKPTTLHHPLAPWCAVIPPGTQLAHPLSPDLFNPPPRPHPVPDG